jgi:hypothetical protein
MDNEIRSLITSIIEAQDEIAMIEKEYKLKENKARLKELLLQRLLGDMRKVEVEYDGAKAQLFLRSLAPKVDLVKLKELLHSNTYRAVVKERAPSKILEVEHV